MRISITVEEVYLCIREIESGKKISEVSKEKYIKPEILRSYILEYGGIRGKNVLLKELEEQLPISMEELIERYVSGKTMDEIADDLGVGRFVIRNIISKYEAISGKKFHRRKITNKRDDIDTEYIIDEYRKGKGISKIAEEIGASVTAVKKRIEDYKKEHEDDIEGEHEENLEKIRTVKRLERKANGRKKYISKKIETKEEQEKKRNKEKEQIKLVEEIIRTYGYSYEQLSEIARNRGDEVTEMVYYQALNNIRKNEERDE